MIDYKIVTFIVLYVLSFNVVSDAKADQWNATYHTAPTNQPFNNADAGKTLNTLNEQTQIGYESNVIKLQWSGATPPTSSNGSDAVETYHLLVNTDQVFQNYTDWTQGTIESNYYPTPVDRYETFDTPILIQTSLLTPFGLTDNNEVLDPVKHANYVNYTGYYFITSKDQFNAFEALISSAINADPESFFNKNSTYSNIRVIYDYLQSGYYYRIFVLYDYTNNSGNTYTDNQYYINTSLGSCQAGYTFNFEDHNDIHCELTNANAVKFPNDGICEAKLTNGEFVYTSRDPDCSKRSITGLGTSNNNADSTITASTPEKTLYLVSTASGTVSAYEKTYSSATDTTQTLIGNIFSDQTFNYLQELNTSGNQTAIAPSVIDSSNGNNGATTAGGDTSNSDAKLDEIFQDGEIADSDTLVGNEVINPFENIFTPLQNYQLPIQSGACPTVDIEYFDSPVNFGMHCQLFEDHKPTLQNAMALIFMIASIRIVLSA